MSEEQAKVYKNPNNDPKGRWRAVPMTAQGYRPNQMYPIVDPKGGIHYPPEGRCWSTIEPEFKKLLAQGRIYFGKNNDSQPNTIRYLSEVEGVVPSDCHQGWQKLRNPCKFGSSTVTVQDAKEYLFSFSTHRRVHPFRDITVNLYI